MMEFRKYRVGELLDDLDGHDFCEEVKVKLANGEIVDLLGVQYVNACIGGDDIVYLCEADPIRKKYLKRVSMFVDFCNEILDVCNETYKKLDREFDGDFDNCDIIDIEDQIARSCDDWFKWLKLDIKYEPGCGTEDELYFKIEVLEKWLKKQEIPKEVPVF